LGTLKAAERAGRGEGKRAARSNGFTPACRLTRAVKIQNAPPASGSNWTEPGAISRQVDEEIGELARELYSGASADGSRINWASVLRPLPNLARRCISMPKARSGADRKIRTAGSAAWKRSPPPPAKTLDGRPWRRSTRSGSGEADERC